ncbi:MAG TPA: serine hydrolase domain-containing protein, partial [Candidatus Polarisedimenticolaceae bacterium]|nr:serine hydrolase domain-containing protein [Candidatus Polarisedimenticolaceae bacterium]
MRRLLPLTALVVLLLAGCASEGLDTSKEPKNAAGLKVATSADLGARLEAWRAEAGVPGLGAAVLRGDDLEVAVAGKRRIDRDAPLAPADLFHLGSDTKAMTASIVARLVDRGLLRWDQTLANAMPEIADMDPAFETATLDMLLRHVSGLPGANAFTDEFTRGFDEAWPLPRQRAWMARRFLSR